VLLLLDFDGTITDRDTLDLIAGRYAPEAFAAGERAFARGEITLNELIAAEFAAVRATREELLALLREEVGVRPGLPELVDFCRERFIEPVIVSSGFRELIEPFLTWHGLRLPVVAHRATFTHDGAIVDFLERAACPACGEPCKRAGLPDLAAGRQVAYVGDGASDRCGAEAADLVFARGSLAQHLGARRIPYQPFDDFYDVRAGLAAFLAPA
jgi:HAD superfamily phosphoserine phosphatase-like hydrolase